VNGGAARWPQVVARGAGRLAGSTVVASVPTAAPLVALTVDDGPHPRTTPALLDALAATGARATFFLIGERAERLAWAAPRIAAAGHELGNHLWRDEPSVLLPAAAFATGLHRTHDLLAAHGAVRWFRPGSGWFTPRMLHAAGALGYGCALASPRLVAAACPDPERLAVRLAGRCRAGDVVVLHEGDGDRARVADLAGALAARLADRGLRVTGLDDLVAHRTRPL